MKTNSKLLNMFHYNDYRIWIVDFGSIYFLNKLILI